jgi:UDP-glucose 4-epimerase
LILKEETIGEVFNIGGQGEISILDLAKLTIGYTNSKSSISFIKYKDAYAVGYEDMARRVPDISKVKQYIGWSPTLNIRNIISDVSNSI